MGSGFPGNRAGGNRTLRHPAEQRRSAVNKKTRSAFRTSRFLPEQRKRKQPPVLQNQRLLLVTRGDKPFVRQHPFSIFSIVQNVSNVNRPECRKSEVSFRRFALIFLIYIDASMFPFYFFQMLKQYKFNIIGNRPMLLCCQHANFLQHLIWQTQSKYSLVCGHLATSSLTIMLQL